MVTVAVTGRAGSWAGTSCANCTNTVTASGTSETTGQDHDIYQVFGRGTA
jgi:hypothetical protein